MFKQGQPCLSVIDSIFSLLTLDNLKFVSFVNAFLDGSIFPPCDRLDSDVLRLLTFARNYAGDRLIPSEGRQPQHSRVLVVAGVENLTCRPRTAFIAANLIMLP